MTKTYKMNTEEIEKLGKEEMKKQYGYNAFKPYYDRGFLLGYKKAQTEQLTIPRVVSTLKDKEAPTFEDWLKSTDVQIDRDNIWVNGVALDYEETLIEVYKELR